MPSTRTMPGLVPITLAPLLEKRIALKTNLLTMPSWDPRRKRYKAWAAAHKALLVTCFGYLGYRNARFGRIEAHEAVTTYGRECLLRAKEAAEEMGYTVLHVYVDAVLIQKPGVKSIEEVQPLLKEILDRTGLPIALDGIFRWVAFLPSTQDSRVSVANRYFGVFQSGEVKARGIDLRRHDTCPFIKATQEKMLEILAQASGMEDLPEKLRDVRRCVRRQLAALRSGRVPLEQLVVRQTLSRELELFKTPSPAAVAAAQLQEAGKPLRPGQTVRLLYMRGEIRARAWDLPGPIDPRTIDIPEYQKLLLRAVETIEGPFRGLEKGYCDAGTSQWSEYPLFARMSRPQTIPP